MVGLNQQSQQELHEMKQFEYKFVKTNTVFESEFESYLNKLGSEGWELVCLDEECFVLKREKAAPYRGPN